MRQAVEDKPSSPARDASQKDAAPRDRKPAEQIPASPGKPKSPSSKSNNSKAAASESRNASRPAGNGSKKGTRTHGRAGQNKPAARKEFSPQQGKNRQAPVAPNEIVSAPKDEVVSSKPAPKPEIDVEAAQRLILESTKILLTNISEGGEIRVKMDTTPIEVVIDDEANSGLIIGRDGQTISSMQYLLNRIVSRKFPGIARIQLDAGDYREKQDEQLRKTAQFLAEKAKSSHRTQSTRPLSSYHRRVVHMALQEDREIMTRSKGDGPMKRVLVMARRKKNANQAGGPNGNGSEPVDQGAMAEQEADEQVS
jgi:spoIIIJ-associated protein